MFNTLTAAAAILADFFATSPIIAIPEHRVSGVTKLFASFARKAAKLDVAAPSLVALSPDLVSMPKWRVVRIVAEDGSTQLVMRLVLVPCRVYAVVGLTPRLAGRFELLARVEFVNGSALVACAPGRDVPASYRSGSPHCDHCKTARARKLAYVVRDCESDTLIQVGGSCIVDFFGQTSAAELAHRFTMVDSLTRYASGDEDEDERGGRSTHEMIVTFLTACVVSIRIDGFRSTKADWSTLDDARKLLHNDGELLQRKIMPGDAERACALLTRARARYEGVDLATLSNYEANMAVILRSDIVDGRLALATLASLPQMFARIDADAAGATAEAAAPKRHVGTVGTREVFTLTYVRTTSFENQWGTSSFHTFHDAAGNVLSWKTSGGSLRDGSGEMVAVGAIVSVLATVKAHDTYKGTPQTVITRVSFDLPKAKRSKAA
jgi:hypothetical protein